MLVLLLVQLLVLLLALLVLLPLLLLLLLPLLLLTTRKQNAATSEVVQHGACLGTYMGIPAVNSVSKSLLLILQ